MSEYTKLAVWILFILIDVWILADNAIHGTDENNYLRERGYVSNSKRKRNSKGKR